MTMLTKKKAKTKYRPKAFEKKHPLMVPNAIYLGKAFKTRRQS